MKKLFVILIILVILGTFILSYLKNTKKEPTIIEKTTIQKEEIRLNPVPIDWPVEKEDKG